MTLRYANRYTTRFAAFIDRDMEKGIEEIKGVLTRHKMQARQIFPNTIIVPYERAMKAVDNAVRYYEDKIEKEFVQIIKAATDEGSTKEDIAKVAKQLIGKGKADVK